MLRRLIHTFTSQRGQTLLEFAFIMPFIIILLFAILDFGLALDRRITLQHAVREGARFAAVHASIDDVKDRTVQQAQGIIDSGDVEVCYIDGPDADGYPGDAGDQVRVTATFTYEPRLFGGMLATIGPASAPSIEMTPSGTARLEQSVSGASACPP